MRKKSTRKRPYFKMESAMTAMLRDASGKTHHGILFDPPLGTPYAFNGSHGVAPPKRDTFFILQVYERVV